MIGHVIRPITPILYFYHDVLIPSRLIFYKKSMGETEKPR